MSDTGEPRRARVRIGLGAAIVVLFVGLACAVLFSALAPKGETGVLSPGDGAAQGGAQGGGAGGAQGGLDNAPPTSTAPSGAMIFVHILGAVAKPGLYELQEGDRGVDAIAAAGGFSADADQTQLNLARFMTDGEQIVVPVVGAAPPVAAGGAEVPGKININTADAAALETLPRVGPAMAERIIAWRDTNGRFTAVEDLMSVSGVGEKTFEQLRELVTV